MNIMNFYAFYGVDDPDPGLSDSCFYFFLFCVYDFFFIFSTKVNLFSFMQLYRKR